MMEIVLATPALFSAVRQFDRHIQPHRLRHCIAGGQVYLLRVERSWAGVLRYRLFWETIPFLDLLYIDQRYRGLGWGRKLMGHWEAAMAAQGFRHGMLSTQADEAAKHFYEKLGYRLAGSFYPPEQEAAELIYTKVLG